MGSTWIGVPVPLVFRFILYQQKVRRYRGIEIAQSVFVKARRLLADPENTNQQGAKSTNPETGEDENEVTDLSGKKEDETSSRR
jgi:hypothetical protein